MPASMASAQDTVYSTADGGDAGDHAAALVPQCGVDDQRQADRVQHGA